MDTSDEPPFERRRRRKEPEGESEDWLVTYADAITLLMAFFVLMYGMSEVDQEKYEHVRAGIIEALGAEGEPVPKQKSKEFETVVDDMEKVLEDTTDSRDVNTKQTPKGIEIELNSGAMYENGKATIRRSFKPVLRSIAKELLEAKKRKFVIHIDGHTDDVPINSFRYPSNWELSAARATKVVRYFTYLGLDPGIMNASAYADTRPKAPNRNKKGYAISKNQEKNRRVVIRIEQP
jgi:chemotaxis protein MotB